MATKYLTEILEEINKDTSSITKYTENAALRMLFQYAFIPEKKFELPEGEPPYKKDAAPIGMSPANFTQEMKKLYVFTKERPLGKIRREQLFVQLLENIHPSEATILIAVKDQCLTNLYKNITVDLLADRGFISQELKSKNGAASPKKS